MADEQRNKAGRKMKIAQLVSESGVNKSTIHHYLNIGLLHRPTRTGLSNFCYDETHVKRLKQISKLRRNKRLPLSEINTILGDEEAPLLKAEWEKEQSAASSAVTPEKETTLTDRTHQIKKEKIVDTAIEIFSKKGYKNTRIQDITNALQMGKGTFYLYFKGKEDLFLECIERLTLIVVPKESWDEIRGEHDFLSRIEMRTVAVLKAFPSYSGIFGLTGAALTSDDAKLAEKAKRTFSALVRPLIKDLQWAITHGTIREVDSEMVAYFIIGMVEKLGYRLMIDSRYTPKMGAELLIDFLAHALMPGKAGAPRKARLSRQGHP